MKHYELHKSNETSTLAITREIKRLQIATADKQDAIVSSIIETAISFIVAIEASAAPSISEVSTWTKLLAAVGVFLVSFGLVALLIKAVLALRRWLRGKKATQAEQIGMRDLFYQTILNHLITGISLKEKALSMKSSTRLLFLHEAIYYFQLSYEEIESNRMFTQDGVSKDNHKAFLKLMNRCFLHELFTLCASTLSEILAANDWDSDTVASIKALRSGYNIYITNISHDEKPSDNSNAKM